MKFIDGEAIQLLTLDIYMPAYGTSDMYSHILIIEKFKGTIEVTSNVRVENGRLPVSIGGDILLSILAITKPEPRITITQKTLNLL